MKTFTIFLVIFLRATLILTRTASTTTSPPNIVIIMADDMGLDDVSFRGSNEFLTPNIDALAYHGKILNRLYTPPMCTPSRATLLTGLYPIHTGTQHYVILNEDPWGILENITSMAEVFQASGYATHLVGKWHLGMGLKEFTPTFKGFDSHYGYWGAYVDYFAMRSKMPSNYSLGYDFRRNMDLECVAPGNYVTDLFSQEAETIILNSKADQPLFLMVNHLATHTANDEDPLQAPQEEIDKFAYIPDINRRTYAAMASKLDESVGRIVEALAKANKLDNSIVIFYSDNGAPSAGLFNNTGSNWPLRGQKNSPWEGGIRVAGAIWSPLLKNRNSIFQPPMYVGDWLPTLAAAANISLEHFNLQLDGINVWPELVSSKTETLITRNSDREIVHMLDNIYEVKSYMKGQLKYIKGSTINGEFDYVLLERNPNITDPRKINYAQLVRNSLVSQALRKYDNTPLTSSKIQNMRSQAEVKCGVLKSTCNPLQEECLFNIWQDPCEENNLAGHPLYASTLAKMRRRLEDLQASAVTPKTGGSVIDNDPSRHNCMWTNFLEEPVANDMPFNLYPHHPWISFVVVFVAFVYLPLLTQAQQQNNVNKSKKQPQLSDKPNIVIILIDDMGFNDVSFHGSNQILTPNIDALAYNGIILNKNYVPNLCTPSRSTLLTGKYPIHTGMHHFVIVNDEPWGLPLNERLMPEIFRDAGYSTNLVGKWHLGFYRKEMTPLYRGFDHHVGYYSGYIGYYDHQMRMLERNYTGLDMRCDLKPCPEFEGIYATDLFTEEAEHVIRNHNTEKPLFLVLSHLAVHTGNEDNPLEAPEEEVKKFMYITDRKRRKYAAMVSLLDKSVGLTVKALKEKGILDNTIILLYSDNGAPTVGIHANSGSNYPFRGQKESPWEGGIRSAGLIWSPLLQQKRYVSNQVIHAIDWLPTLAAAAGITLPLDLNVDGLNVWPALNENLEPQPRRLLHVYDDVFGYSSYMRGHLKYVNGSSFNGKYDTWLGNINFEEQQEEAKHYEQEVLNSEVHKYLCDSELTEDMIKSLRMQATFKCPDNNEDFEQAIYKCEPLKAPCYFNLDKDPCERYNLANLYPLEMQFLAQEVEEYRWGVMPSARIPHGDPLANPSRHKGLWQWWYEASKGNTAAVLNSSLSLKYFIIFFLYIYTNI